MKRIECFVVICLFVFSSLALCLAQEETQEALNQLNEYAILGQQLVTELDRQIFDLMPEKAWENAVKGHDVFMKKIDNMPDFRTQEERLKLPFVLRRDRKLVVDELNAIKKLRQDGIPVDKELLWQNIVDMKRLQKSIQEYRREKILEHFKKHSAEEPVKRFAI